MSKHFDSIPIVSEQFSFSSDVVVIFPDGYTFERDISLPAHKDKRHEVFNYTQCSSPEYDSSTQIDTPGESIALTRRELITFGALALAGIAIITRAKQIDVLQDVEKTEYLVREQDATGSLRSLLERLYPNLDASEIDKYLSSGTIINRTAGEDREFDNIETGDILELPIATTE